MEDKFINLLESEIKVSKEHLESWKQSKARHHDNNIYLESYYEGEIAVMELMIGRLEKIKYRYQNMKESKKYE